MAPALGGGVRQEALEQAQVRGASWPPLLSPPICPVPGSGLPAKKTSPVLFKLLSVRVEHIRVHVKTQILIG